MTKLRFSAKELTVIARALDYYATIESAPMRRNEHLAAARALLTVIRPVAAFSAYTQQYRGDVSRPFWQLVAALHNDIASDRAYELGIEIQDREAELAEIFESSAVASAPRRPSERSAGGDNEPTQQPVDVRGSNGAENTTG